ncbi:aldehyde dehydrogenase family protein, partial [Nannocystis pusilla]|uniref:aldehyde dehydrogenase family protein n=1 Tax=Nannocystis pusilla TaxID=889268 RepID=UPI003BF38F7A
GGEKLQRPGQFFAPTLLTGVTPEMEIFREETFGPVLPVIRVRGLTTRSLGSLVKGFLGLAKKRARPK